MRSSRSWWLGWGLLACLLGAVPAHAASDDSGGAPPPEPAQPVPATVIVQPPGAQPPTMVQPERRFLWFQLRGGPGIPLAGNIASNGGFGGFGSGLVGIQTQSGFSIAFNLGGRYFANSVSSLPILSIGAVLRYTLLRDVVIHPFGEIGLDLHYPLGGTTEFGRSYPQPQFGATGAIGVEYDITVHISLELAARATVFGGDGGADFVFEPWLGFTYYR
jgi:hypothetical protein